MWFFIACGVLGDAAGKEFDGGVFHQFGKFHSNPLSGEIIEQGKGPHGIKPEREQVGGGLGERGVQRVFFTNVLGQ